MKSAQILFQHQLSYFNHTAHPYGILNKIKFCTEAILLVNTVFIPPKATQQICTKLKNILVGSMKVCEKWYFSCSVMRSSGSVCSSDTLMIWVQILQKRTVFSLKCWLKRTKINKRPGAYPIKILQPKFYATIIFKHHDWLINLSSRSECLKN